VALFILACAATRPVSIPELTASTELTVRGVINRAYLEQQAVTNSGLVTAVRDGSIEPVSFAFAPAGTVVVADQKAGRLWTVPSPGGVTPPRAAPVVGTTTLREPGFVRVDQIGNVYISGVETGAITVCDPRLRLVGTVEPPFAALGLVVGRLTGIAFGPQGEFYLADQTNALIYRYDAAGAFVAAFGSGDDAAWGRLVRPTGLACASDGGAVYVCDPGTRRVVVFDPGGVPLRVFGGTDLVEPRAIAVDARGQCFVADEGAKAVVVFSAEGRLVRTIADLPPLIGRWERPTDVAVVDSTLWIADAAAGRIVAVALRQRAH